MAYIWMLVGSIFFAIMALLAESLKEQFSYPWIAMIRSGVASQWSALKPQIGHLLILRCLGNQILDHSSVNVREATVDSVVPIRQLSVIQT